MAIKNISYNSKINQMMKIVCTTKIKINYRLSASYIEYVLRLKLHIVIRYECTIGT